MIKRIWSKDLFAEGIRQTYIVGIFAIIITILIMCILSPNYIFYPRENIEVQNPEIYIITIIHVVPLVFPFILMQRLFKVMNKRNSVDFYFSKPINRLKMYITNCTVVLSILLVIIVFTFVTYILLTANYFSLKSLLLVYAYIFASAILIMGAMAIASSLTGRSTATFFVSITILLCPGYIANYFWNMVYKLVPYVCEEENAISFLNPDRNFIYRMTESIFDGYFGVVMEEIKEGTLIYTATLAIIYLVIGGILFCKRKNEGVRQFIIGKRFGLLLKIMVTMIMAISTTDIVVSSIISKTISKNSIITIVIQLLFALLVWTALDFLFTNKKRKLLTYLKHYSVYVCINIVAVIAVFCGIKVSEKIPEASEIECIHIDLLESNMPFQYMLPYNENVLKQVEIKDSDTIALLIQELKNTIKFHHSSIVEDRKKPGDFAQYISVEFVGSEGNMKRNILLNQLASKQLYEAFYEGADNTYDYEFPIVDISELEYRDKIYGVSIDEEECLQIYKTFKEEVKAEKLPLSYFAVDQNYPDNALAALGYGSRGFAISLDTPKTGELFLDMVCSKGNGYELESLLESVRENNVIQNVYELKLILWDKEEKIRFEHLSWNYPITPEMSDEEITNLMNIVSDHESDVDFSLEDRFLIAVYTDANSGEWNCIKMNITEEEAEIMRGIIWSEGYLSDELNN